MRILARYILKEFFPPFIIALICFTFILIFDDLFRLTNLFVKKGISPLYLVELLIYVMPATIVLSLPMAALVAILLALGRLSTNNEIIAMKAHGVAFHHLMLPFLVVVGLLSIVDLVLMDYALPQANLAYAALKRDIQRHNPAFVLEEATVMKELETEGKLWMYESTDRKSGRMQNVKIWDGIWGGRPRFSHAQEATLGFENGRAMLTLYDGRTYEPTTDNSDGYRVTKFQQQNLALQLTEDLERGTFQNQTPRSMRIAQLGAFVDTLEGALQTSKNPEFTLKKLRFAQVEYHKKFSIPFACLAFGLMGIPLGLMVKQSGKMIGFGIGLVVILVYYLLLQVGQSTGLNGILSPVLAMWLPNIVIGVFGIALSIRVMGEGKLRTWRDRDRKLPIVVNRKAES
ncbi:MAG: LptF/LptG family permease [Candidatus Poribacteria bacterium]|nr:LptF/LptG family permease [Candidatus Poribacteria bacterium]MDD9973079.1 LptF/LptG family permease [Candidatus Poribacteria bacterium]MDE0325383.1 LptF/LptG family permease [Candidatus Poribacteria bacterium]